MAWEHKAGQFTLFKNDKKGNQKRPDYRGDGADLEGNPIEIACWIKEGKNGGKFMSCNFKRKDEQKTQRPIETNTPPYDPEEIPF